MAACYFTNLTKCQKDAPSIPWSTRQVCFDLYLSEELHVIRPRAALLFGDNAAVFAPQMQALGPRVILAQHPSARPPLWLNDPDRSRLIREIRAAIA